MERGAAEMRVGNYLWREEMFATRTSRAAACGVRVGCTCAGAAATVVTTWRDQVEAVVGRWANGGGRRRLSQLGFTVVRPGRKRGQLAGTGRVERDGWQPKRKKEEMGFDPSERGRKEMGQANSAHEDFGKK